MDGATSIAIAAITAVPASIAAWAAVIAARRTGGKGNLIREQKKLTRRVNEHVTDVELHPALANRRQFERMRKVVANDA